MTVDLDLIGSPTGSPLSWASAPPLATGNNVDRLVAALAEHGVVDGQDSDAGVRWLEDSEGSLFPCVGGVPMLTWQFRHDRTSLTPRKSAYEIPTEEMLHYTRVSLGDLDESETSVAWRATRAAQRAVGPFPQDLDAWIDAAYDAAAQLRGYQHVAATLPGGIACQLGGTGIHAVKMLLAGAKQAVLISPVPGEVFLGIELAKCVGVADRLVPVVGMGEEIPVRDATLDVVYCGGTLHHMDTRAAGAAIHRILRPGGRWAAIEPWRVPFLYGLGTRIFGKREREVHCKPIDPLRLRELRSGFGANINAENHGAILRYPLLAARKLGIRPNERSLTRWALFEDRHLPSWLRRLGGSFSIIGER